MTADFEVAAFGSDLLARQFVAEHHYEGSYPAARYRFGLWRGQLLAGVAVYSVPVNPASLLCTGTEAAIELGRFVLLDDVPANGESWFIARTFDLLRRESIEAIVSFSDPVPRTGVNGVTVFRGHIGTIYQATNAVYLGRSKPGKRLLLPDGTVFHRRALTKIRARDRGWRYAVEQLEYHGAPPFREGTDWLGEAVRAVTRPLHHGGNYKYVFGLSRAVKKALPKGLPYPKAPKPNR